MQEPEGELGQCPRRAEGGDDRPAAADLDQVDVDQAFQVVASPAATTQATVSETS